MVFFRGVLHLSNDSFGMEPLDSDPQQHIVYRLQDVTSQPMGCGTPHIKHGYATHAQYGSEESHRNMGHHKRVGVLTHTLPLPFLCHSLMDTRAHTSNTRGHTKHKLLLFILLHLRMLDSDWLGGVH